MSDNPWGFDRSGTTAPPVRPRPLVGGAPAPTGERSARPPAPPVPPDPFGFGATSPGPFAPAGPPSVPLAVGPGVPTAPPTLGAVAVSSPVAVPARRGRRTFLAFLAGGLLVAGGFGLGIVYDRNDTSSVSASGSTLPASSQNPVVVTPPDLDTTEPAAFVASILGPSVVQIETNLGLGSGVVYQADGLILTNNHVIEGATAVRVRLSDGRSLPAEVLGSDARTDIAVVSVGAGHDLVVATLALDEPLEVGQYTVAIGSPFELQQTVTSGIVSAINRPVYNGTGWNAMVQTDAAINPGNSGGALADREGRVIGINTAIQTDGVSSTNAGIGFAMPITTAYEIAGRLLSGESLDPGFLGISGGEPGTDEVGVAVVEVTPGSAAADAGLLVGDRVLSLDGAPVSGFEQLAGLIQTSFPGEVVVLQVIRDGAVIDVEVTLGER